MQTGSTKKLRALVLSTATTAILMMAAAPVDATVHCRVDDRGAVGATIGATVDTGNNYFRDDLTGTLVTIISAGEAVQWRVTQGCHTISHGFTRQIDTPGSPEYESGALAPFDQETGATGISTFTFEFKEPGIYSYFCRPHDDQMRGVVVVTP